MTTYVALLRGINVSGQKAIRMAELQASCRKLGFEDIKTYLQSGNIVFKASESNTTTLAGRIKAQIAADFGHDVQTVVLSAKLVSQIANSNQLWPESGGDETLFHATFLFQPVAESTFHALKLPLVQGERATLAGQVVYLHCPHGYGRTKLNNSFFEKALGVAATTRNWRTVLALHQLCQTP